jgi:hypothetical protein
MLLKILRNISILKHKREKIEQILYKFLCLRSTVNKAINVVFKSKKHLTKAQLLLNLQYRFKMAVQKSLIKLKAYLTSCQI